MRTAFGWFLRDLKNGELTLLLSALILAIAATSSLRFFSQSVETGLQQEAARLMAADLIISSSRPLPDNFSQLAEHQHLAIAHKLEFSSVLLHNDNFQLSGIDAVSSLYPLRGEIKTKAAISNSTTVTRQPKKGEIWIDERLLTLLDISLGESLQLGEHHFKVTAILSHQPGLGGGLSVFSPRALINLDDVAATGIVQPGSRLRYQLMLSGKNTDIKQFKTIITPQLAVSEKIHDINDNTRVGTPLMQSQRYFSFAAILAVVLAGLAILVSSRRFAQRHLDLLALLKSLGASRRKTTLLIFSEILWAALAALVVGLVLGIATAYLINHVIVDLLPQSHFIISLWEPLLIGTLTALLALIGFALPALISLSQVSPLRVLRRDAIPRSWSSLSLYAIAITALALLMVIETQQPKLTLMVLISGAVFSLIIWKGLAALLSQLRHRLKSPTLASLFRNPSSTSLQIIGMTIGLTALLLVVSLRGELFEAWYKKIPPTAPNYFAVNIAADDIAPLSSNLKQQHIVSNDFFPVIRGRLIAINQKPVQQAVSKEKEPPRDEALNRELSLTWRHTLHEGTSLLAGKWWDTATGCPCVSVESKLAERLSIKIGDTLEFSMAEGNLSATVSSLRSVDWDTFQPNFYFIFSPHALDAFPASYITSFRAEPQHTKAISQLIQQFPTLVFLDISGLMEEVKKLLDKVALAIEVILLFVLVGGVLVIASQIMASLDERRLEASLLRVLGISQQQLKKRLFFEFITLGLLAGCLAAFLNEAIAAIVYIYALELRPTLHFSLWWQAPLAGALLSLSTGFLGLRHTWRSNPLRVLRHNS